MKSKYSTEERKINYLAEYDVLRKNNNDYSLSYNSDDMLFELYRLVSYEDIFKSLNAYPELAYNNLRKLIQNRYNINNVIFGSGSEELIFRINREFSGNMKVGVVAPIFYRVTETLNRCPTYLDINDYMKGGEFLIDEFISTVEQRRINVIWIANPNSIYGSAISRDAMLCVIKKCPKVIFIVDEVSIDFLDHVEKYELIQEAEKNSNLIVIKSMSKYYGVPGLRIGLISANETIISKLEKNSCVYPVNNLSYLYIKKALENDDKFFEMKKKIQNNAQRLKKLFKETPINMLEPTTNTVVLWWESNSDLWNLLAKYNIISLSLKNVNYVHWNNAVRLTIHSGEKFEHLYEKMRTIKKIEFNE